MGATALLLGEEAGTAGTAGAAVGEEGEVGEVGEVGEEGLCELEPSELVPEERAAVAVAGVMLQVAAARGAPRRGQAPAVDAPEGVLAAVEEAVLP